MNENMLKYAEGLGWLACLRFLADAGIMDAASDDYMIVLMECSNRYSPAKIER